MILGLDIGGANLKASDGERWAATQPFELWRRPDELADAIAALVAGQAFDAVTVTMSGELADCYASKAEGVARIVAACERVADGRPVLVWQTAGEFVGPATATEFWPLTAASNWHVQATWAARCDPNAAAVLVDAGSTTTDVIPIERGLPVAAGQTDVARLKSCELIYAGIGRTPATAFGSEVTLRDDAGVPVRWSLVPEFFATTADIWQVAEGTVANDDASNETPDRRSQTLAAARHRLARQLCADECELPSGVLDAVAAELRDRQLRRTLDAIVLARGRCGGTAAVTFVLSGSATPLLAAVATHFAADDAVRCVRLADVLSTDIAAAAGAFATAVLASERVTLASARA